MMENGVEPTAHTNKANNNSSMASTSSTTAAINNNSNDTKQQQNHVAGNKHAQLNGHNSVDSKGGGKSDKSEGKAVGNAEEKKKPIRLNSPAATGSSSSEKNASVSWHWSEREKSSIGVEVLDIIRLTIFHFPELENALKSKLGKTDSTNYDEVRSLAKKFNKAVKETAQIRNPQVRAKELFHHVMTRCYNRAVDNEKALNKHYEAFSSETYGETSFERMQLIIDELKPTEKDVFVDLGSGVGQLVTHMAGATPVQKAVGIEIASLPSSFAKKLEAEFKKWMTWFGRPFQPFELKQGNFLSSEHRKLIAEEATIIFINNYAFQSDLESRIKRELLSDLKDGTRIISTKPYVPLNKQVTDRQMNDISVITEVTEMQPCPNPCSWTSAYVPYYLHTINRAKLQQYFEKLRNNTLRAKSTDTGSRRSSTPNSKASNSRESSIGIRDKSSDNIRLQNGGGGGGDDAWYGPSVTTRRKWNEYVSGLEMQKQQKKGSGSNQHSGASSSDNASTAASTPAPQSGGSQLTNSSTTGSEATTAMMAISMAAAQNSTSCPIGKQPHQPVTQPDTLMPPSMTAENGPVPTAPAKPLNGENAEASLPAANHLASPLASHSSIGPSPAMNVGGASLTPAAINNTNVPVLAASVARDLRPRDLRPTGYLARKSYWGANLGGANLGTPAASSSASERVLMAPKFEPISPAKPSSSKRAPAKRSYERKEKGTTAGGTRGRPRKTDRTHTSPKQPRLSDDARDGMELMHAMTCAVQSGKPMDAATILADMANQRRMSAGSATTTAVNAGGANNSHHLMLDNISPPFPNLDNPPGPSTSAGNMAMRNLDAAGYGLKYPGLNKFLDGLRNCYEHFFDDFYAKKGQPGPNDSSLKEELRVDIHQQHQQSQPEHHTFQPGMDQLQQFRSILDQTPVKRPLDDLADLAAAATSSGGSNASHTMLRMRTGGDRVEELQKRVQERRKRMADKLSEYQQEAQLLDAELEALVAECRRQQDDVAQQSLQHQMQQQQHQLVQQQQQQQQLIAAAQAQLAAAAAQAQAQQNAVAAAATAVVFNQQQASQQQQQQVNQNQLELLINEMRERYSQQLTAQHLLTQISQYGLLNVIAPQEIAALQSIASGAALNGVLQQHQMSPIAAAAAVLHSPVAQAPSAGPQPGPSPAQLQQNGPVVQNFFSQLDSMNNAGAASISANVSAVAAELAHTASTHGMNTASANTQPGHHPLGQTASLSLHQVSQNFPCPQQMPSTSSASTILQQHQLSRESTVAEVVAEVAALPSSHPRKPFRPRPARTNGAAAKRAAQNAQKQQQQTVEDPKKQEEIERQIQDIVAKALEVDSAAKSAEKDRKARGGEKRSNKEKNGGGSNGTSSLLNASTIPTTSIGSGAASAAATIQGRVAATSNIEFQVKADNAIMQNFLSAAVAASQQQQHNPQSIGINPILSSPVTPQQIHHHRPDATTTPILDGQRTPSMSDFRSAMASAVMGTLTPKLETSPSLNHQQQHFNFTPSSISLAIQGGPTPTFSTPTSTLATRTPQNTSPANNFLHPSESCSPPFISLNLPPASCTLGPPPTNVVVKVESKVPGPQP